MRELVVREDRELRRIEAAIASIKRDPRAAQKSRSFLLKALEMEREELLQSYGHSRRRARDLAA